MNEQEVFAEALLRTDPAERAAFLDEVFADAAARCRMEELLTLHSQDHLLLDRLPLEGVAETMDLRNLKVAESPTPEAVATLLSVYLSPSDRAGALGRLAYYDVLKVLGHGGFGYVVKAFDNNLHRVVAIKILAPHLATSSPARKRFIREARAAAQVKHENVVQIYAVEEEPLPYLVMEFVDGPTVQQRLDDDGPLDAAEVVRVGVHIARGLAAAHDKGLIHRDVKPGNILLESGVEPRAKLTDFGLARACDDASMTQSGVIAGTPMFMAPEQAKGGDLDHRADLFSFGGVLYTMATGHPPFRAPTTLAVLRRVAEDTPRPIREIIPETPPWLCDIIVKLLAKNPDDRFRSGWDVAEALAAGEAKQTSNGQTKRVLPASRPRGRKWAAAAVALFLLLALAGTEVAGLTHLFRKTADDVQPDGDPIPHANANKEPTAPPTPKELPSEPMPAIALDPPAATVHDTRLKAVALLPVEEHAAALSPLLKERLAGFDEAYLRAIPVVRSDRQVVMAEAWLRERKPAFGGFEDAWLKALPKLSGEAQAVLVAAWLRELNPAFEGEVASKVDGGVLTSLEVRSQLVQDLAPLRMLPKLRSLTGRSTLGYDNRAARDAVVLRSLKSLETINGKPVGEFWKHVEAKQAEFNEWLKLVPLLTPPQQVAVVADKLKEYNPDFAGKADKSLILENSVQIRDGEVVGLGLTPLTDLSPVRALVGLEILGCKEGGPLTDLSPLAGMKLKHLNLYRCRLIKDLSPLKGLPLTHLDVDGSQIHDLSPLKEMPLLHLNICGTQVSDLEQLKGMKLETLLVNSTSVVDLTPLRGMPLSNLSLTFSRGVTDLGPLRGMKLEYFSMRDVPVTDLSPLQGMPLKQLDLCNSKVDDLQPLRGMPLESLVLERRPITDLSPLKGLLLRELSLHNCPNVSDLAVLQGMPLEVLRIDGTAVTDLTPLKGLSLKRLNCDFKPDRDGKILRAITTLEQVNDKPVVEFWKDVKGQ